MEQDEVKIQPYTTKELTAILKTTPKTFRKWIAGIKPEIGTRIGNYYNPKQVRVIFNHLGQRFSWIGALIAKSLLGMDVDGHDGPDEQDDGAL